MPARHTQYAAVEWSTLADPSDHVDAQLDGLHDEQQAPAADLGGRFFRHTEHSVEFLSDLVKAHSVDYRAVDQMIAWADGRTSAHENTTGDEAGQLWILGWTSASVLRWTLSSRLDALNPVAAFRLLDQPEIAALDHSHADYVVLIDRHSRTGARPPDGAISASDIDLWRVSGAGELDGAFAVDFDTYRDWFVGTRLAA